MRRILLVLTAAMLMALMSLPASAQPGGPQAGKYVGNYAEVDTPDGAVFAGGGTIVGSQTGGGGGGHYGEPTGYEGGGGYGGNNVEDPGGLGGHCFINDAGDAECNGSYGMAGGT